MTRYDTIQVRVNSDVRKQAEELFARFGLTVSEALNMLLIQSVNAVYSSETESSDEYDEIYDSPPESLVINSEEELAERLRLAHKDYLEGRYTDGFEFLRQMKASLE